MGKFILNLFNLFNVFKKQQVQIILLACLLLFSCFSPVFAQQEELEQVAAGAGMRKVDPLILVANIGRLVLSFLGLILVIMIIYAGILWGTSGGNEEKIMKAKKIIVSGIIGLLIVVFAFSIVSFVLDKLQSDILTTTPSKE